MFNIIEKEAIDSMYIYLNGKIVPQEEAFISVFDHGFMYGLGLFETFRVYGGHPFLLDDHLTRLNSSLKAMNIDKSFAREEVVQIIQSLLQFNHLQDAYIRWNVSAGNGMIGLQTDMYTDPNIIVYLKPIAKDQVRVEKTGHVVTIPRNTPEGAFRLKSHHYLNNILAKREVGEDLSVEGLFLTREGFVAEGITSNIFWITKDALYTPSLETGILNGITRKFILILAERIGLTIQEGLFQLKDLKEADEVFATNSIQEIFAIKRIDATIFKGLEGYYFNKLLTEYKRWTNQLWSRNELGGIKE